MSGPGRKPETSDADILRAIALHPDRVVTASEIADAVDMTNAGVNKRLHDLVDDDLVVKKEVGSRAVVYWLSGPGKEAISET